METIPGCPLYWRPWNQLGIIKNKLYIWSFYRDTKYWTKTKYPAFLSSLNVHIFSMFRCLNVWMHVYEVHGSKTKQYNCIDNAFILSPILLTTCSIIFSHKNVSLDVSFMQFYKTIESFQDSFKRISIEQIRTHFKCLGIS